MGIVFETEEECLSAVKRDYYNLKDCGVKSHAVCMAAWEQSIDAIKFFPEAEKTEEIQREYVERGKESCDLSVFTFMDEEMALALVEEDKCTRWLRPGYKTPNICYLVQKFPEVVTDKVVEAAVKAVPWIAYKFKDRLSLDFLKEWALTDWILNSDYRKENGELFARIGNKEVYRKALAGIPIKVEFLPKEFEDLRRSVVKKNPNYAKYCTMTKELAFLVLNYVREHSEDKFFHVKDVADLPWGNAFSKEDLMSLEDWQLQIVTDGISKWIEHETCIFTERLNLEKHEEWRSTIELVMDHDVARRILRIDPFSVKWVVAIWGDCDLVDYAIEQNGRVLNNVSKKLLTEERVQLALDHGFNDLDWLPKQFQTNEVVRQCAANGCCRLKQVLNKNVDGIKEILLTTKGIRLTEESIRAVLDTDWDREEKLTYLKNQRIGFCSDLVKVLKVEELKDKELLSLLASKTNSVLYYLGEAGVSKEEVTEIADLAVVENYGCIPYCSEKAKTEELAWKVYRSDWWRNIEEFDSLPEDLVEQAIVEGIIGTGTFTIRGKENSNQLKIKMTTEEMAWCLVRSSPALDSSVLKLIPEELQTPELQVELQLRLSEKGRRVGGSYVFPKSEEYHKLLHSVTEETKNEVLEELRKLNQEFDWKTTEESRLDHLKKVPVDVLTLSSPTDLEKRVALEADPILAQEIYNQFGLTLDTVGGTRTKAFRNLDEKSQDRLIQVKLCEVLNQLSEIQQQTRCFSFGGDYEVDESKLFVKIEYNTNLQLYKSTEKMEFKYNAKYCSIGFANHWANVYYPVKEITDGSVELASPESNGILTLLQVKEVDSSCELSEYAYLVNMDSILQIFEDHKGKARETCLPVILGDFSKALIFKDKIIIPLDISINSLKEMIELVPDWLGLKEPSDEMSSF